MINEEINEEINQLFSLFSEINTLALPLMKRPPDVFEGRTSTIIVTDECNLRCSYCYCEKQPHSMAWETAKEFIDYQFKITEDFHKIPKEDQLAITYKKVWDFVGGEPLLEADLVFKCIAYIEERIETLHENHPWKRQDWPCTCGKQHPSFGYRYMIGTNGLLVNDPTIQRNLLKYQTKIHIGVTLDGDQKMHDICRVDTEGKGSFERVILAWSWLQKAFPAATKTTKSTIAHENLPYIYDLVKFFYHLEPDFFLMQNCVFENVWHWGDQFILFEQLCKVADFLLEGEKYKTFMVRWFDLAVFGKSTSTENWCGAALHMDACDYMGDIYPCLRFKQIHTRDPFPIGTTKTGIDPDRRKELNTGSPIQAPRQLELTGLDCKNCPISMLCSECQAGAYNMLGRLDVKSPFLCPMTKAVAFANVYFFGKLSGFITTPDEEFRDYLSGLLGEYTKDNYFSHDSEGRLVPWTKC